MRWPRRCARGSRPRIAPTRPRLCTRWYRKPRWRRKRWQRPSASPLMRKGVDLAMRLLGKQFVTGRTIAEAIDNAREREARGYRYSYDMLGEAALTAADAERYLAAYENAIDAIGDASQGKGGYAGPGISIKLSALHPRYSRLQRERVLAELLP